MADARPRTMSSSELTPLAAAPESDAALLAEDVEIEADLKVRILSMARDLERTDHYALLGVDRSADRKAVKRAYYELAAAFHPDKYFRKRLGSFKVMMEAIFARLTLAHEILADRERRAEYDNYLREVSRSRGIEDLIADALAEVKRAEEKVASEVGPPVPPASAPAAPPISGASRTAPSSSVPSPPRTSTPIVDEAARREALARRLLGGRSPSSPSVRPSANTGSPPMRPAGPSPAEAMDALRRRYEERLVQAKVVQARKYAQSAEVARASGDPVAAANALRVAAGLAPDDAELKARAAAAQSEADALLGETYTRQAQYEEKNGQWAEAARSWARACRGRPNDAHIHERGANAILKASGDLHQAVKLARRACELEPASVVARTTLASAYLSAGMMLNAKRELETAAQLAPHDGTIRALMDKVAKAT